MEYRAHAVLDAGQASQGVYKRMLGGYSLKHVVYRHGQQGRFDVTITDKVYDRAAVIDFSSRNSQSGLAVSARPVHVGLKKLTQLFDEATSSGDFGLSKEEFERFNKLSDFMLDRFDINFGNRIYNQIMKFVPVYVACGGTAAKALDIMFSRKILRKMEGRFDDGLKTDITALETLINELYGKETFSLTLDAVNKLKRKLI